MKKKRRVRRKLKVGRILLLLLIVSAIGELAFSNIFESLIGSKLN